MDNDAAMGHMRHDLLLALVYIQAGQDAVVAKEPREHNAIAAVV